LGNLGNVESVPIPFEGFDQSLSLSLPPLAILFMEPETGES
jgi:1,4-alpha-glucan branching enzyme